MTSVQYFWWIFKRVMGLAVFSLKGECSRWKPDYKRIHVPMGKEITGTHTHTRMHIHTHTLKHTQASYLRNMILCLFLRESRLLSLWFRPRGWTLQKSSKFDLHPFQCIIPTVAIVTDLAVLLQTLLTGWEAGISRTQPLCYWPWSSVRIQMSQYVTTCILWCTVKLKLNHILHELSFTL